jgi:2-polyprenyl-3-methyl-5-hydroxy-6-metoxy-1,4-benzoquinol methylase
LTLPITSSRISHARVSPASRHANKASLRWRRNLKQLPSFEELQKPLPRFSPKNVYYASIRALLKSVGNLSDGIRTGNDSGYDSGVMLDHVYKNKAGGKLVVGKVIDRFYLNTVGWKGIRLRKILLMEYLSRVLAAKAAEKSSVRYLDIACGGAEYDMEVLKHADSVKVRAELRDYKQENIEKAKHNAEIHGVKNVTFKQADALDAGNYKDKWDIVVVSGFWEIIDDDKLVKGCLLNIAKCLDPGSELVFTIQPYHPQLELIARTLNSNTGKPWIMRLRSLDLFQEWMQEAGLKYVSHQMEKHEIFGVVEAVKA